MENRKRVKVIQGERRLALLLQVECFRSNWRMMIGLVSSSMRTSFVGSVCRIGQSLHLFVSLCVYAWMLLGLSIPSFG